MSAYPQAFLQMYSNTSDIKLEGIVGLGWLLAILMHIFYCANAVAFASKGQWNMELNLNTSQVGAYA